MALWLNNGLTMCTHQCKSTPSLQTEYDGKAAGDDTDVAQGGCGNWKALQCIHNVKTKLPTWSK
jgi:hypothetical protein